MVDHINDNYCLTFTESDKGLYYLDTKESTNEPLVYCSFLNQICSVLDQCIIDQYGIGKDMIPVSIIQITLNLDYKHLKILFGSYAQVKLGTTNNTRERSIGAISLGCSSPR